MDINELVEKHTQYQYADISDLQYEKIIGVPLPGEKIKIHWAQGIVDDGYLFALPINEVDEGDMMFHATMNGEREGGESIWGHINELLTNSMVTKVEVNP